MKNFTFCVFIYFFSLSGFAQVNFTASQTDGCEPLIVDFADNTTGAAKWKWDFGNGNSSTLQNPTSTYLSGAYSVALTAWDASGTLIGTVTKTGLITVRKSPKLDFTADITKVCIDGLVNFTLTNQTGGTLSGFLWDFGDGTTQASQNASHPYRQVGYYNITVKAKDQGGCEGSITKNNFIEVTKGPNIDITATPDFACEIPAKISFRESNNTGFTKYAWHFDDGGTSNQKDPDHVYTAFGSFIAKLVVSDNKGCTKQIDKHIEVRSLKALKLEASPGFLCGPGNCAFWISGGFYNPGLQYDWDFGDGSPHLYDFSSPAHLYSKPGIYNVKLRISFGNCEEELITSVEVSSETIPIVEGSVKQSSSCFPMTLELIDEHFGTGHFWQSNYFGVTISANEHSKFLEVNFPKNLHEAPFIYLIYTYGPDHRCTATRKFTINYIAPTCSYSFKPIPDGCSVRRFNFIAKADQYKGEVKYRWSENGITLSTKAEFEHTFTTSGTHEILLTVTDENNCPFQREMWVSVKFSDLKATITSDVNFKNCPPAICKFVATFFDSTKVDLRTILWKFGDGDSAFFLKPEHIYNNSGNYDVTFSFKDKSGCQSEQTLKDFIFIDGPTAKLAVAPTDGCPGIVVPFAISNLHKVRRYVMDFGDGSFQLDSTAKTIYHAYQDQNSKFRGTLVLFDSLGCKNAIKSNAIANIWPLPEAGFKVSGKCVNQTLVLRSNYGDLGHKGTSGEWFMNGALVGSNKTHKVYSPKAGWHVFMLKTKNEYGCFDSYTKTVKIYDIKAGMDKRSDTVCLGEKIQFFGRSFSDTDIVSQRWFVNKSFVHQGPVWDSLFVTPGRRSLLYVITNAVGCTDSVYDKYGVVVGDTQKPDPVKLFFVTRLANNEDRVEFQASKPDDFRNYFIWDADRNTLLDSISDINRLHYDRFYSAGNPGRKCYKVGLENLCYFHTDLAQMIKHCTVDLEAVPDTNQITIKWSDYQGWDSVAFYELFRLDKDENVGYQSMAKLAPGMNAYVDTTVLCHHHYGYQVHATSSGPAALFSSSDTALKTAPFKHALPSLYPYLVSVGSSDELNLRYAPYNSSGSAVDKVMLHVAPANGNYQFWDTIKIQKDSNIALQIPCDKQIFWLKTSFLNTCGELGSNTKICNNILLKIDPAPESTVSLTWNRYNYWPNKVRNYIVQWKNQAGIFEDIAEIDGNCDTCVFIDKRPQDHCAQYLTYRVAAVPFDGSVGYYNLSESDTSFSNEASWNVPPYVYIPNAFTPNDNARNDMFKPVCLFYKHYDLQIYNRWGQKLLDTEKTCMGGWMGIGAPEGVYAVVLRVRGVDDNMYEFSGTVNLLR